MDFQTSKFLELYFNQSSFNYQSICYHCHNYLSLYYLLPNHCYFYRTFHKEIQGQTLTEKQLKPPEYFCIEIQSCFAHISPTGSLADDNNEGGQRKHEFVKGVKFSMKQFFALWPLFQKQKIICQKLDLSIPVGIIHSVLTQNFPKN